MSSEKDVAVFSSENRVDISVYPLDVFYVSELGNAELHGATRLPPEAIEILVLLDGKATVGDIEQKLPHVQPEVVRDLLRSLLGARLVRAPTIAETEGLDFSDFFNAAQEHPEPSPGTKASADREAASGAPRLERDGYYVSIARQAVKAKKPAAGARLCALVVDDDPDVSTLVARLLEGEGFDVATAANRDELLAGLRRTPAPDLVILDVVLPDVNGFDVLQKLKTHPALKAVPVIMLTAEAKRESVMRGLVGGADGYITKPFEKAVLIAGVKAVLGLNAQ